MTGHTGPGFPYALGSDALTDWPATSLELANALTPPIVTSLPASPNDGTVVYLEVDPGSGFPKVRWLLRWVASLSRWVYLGGPPAYGYNGPIVVPSTAGWTNIAPAIAIPRGGLYLVRWGMAVAFSVAGAGVNVASLITGPGVADAAYDVHDQSATVINLWNSGATDRQVTYSGAGTAQMRVVPDASGRANCNRRWLSILPVQLV